MSPTPTVTGILLAGGRSSRFGSDKLAARVAGERLLDRSAAALAPLVTELLVITEPAAARTLPTGLAVRVRAVRDPEQYGGPLVGLLAGLEEAAEPLVLVAGGDMPSMVPAVLRILTAALSGGEGRGAAALEARGRVVPLPLALRTGAATDAARRLVGDGERRLRAILERLPARVFSEAEWRPLDPTGATLVDVDRPEDLPSR